LIPASNQKLFVVILSAAFSIRRRIREAFWLCLGLVVVGGRNDLEREAYRWPSNSLG
jgi:hypothetical protein